MLIKEVSINNFRIYYGSGDATSIKFDLSDQKKNIYIISGKNGFGKTTFLMSLVWCLYGKQMTEVDELYDKEIKDQKGYNKYISTSLNRLALNEGRRQASVSITFSNIAIEEIPCNEIKIIRTLNLNADELDSVEILVDGERNQLADEIGPEYFIRDYILPKEIAKFFLFDAEKIASLAESNSVEQRKRISGAYSEVLGIKKYIDLRDSLIQIQTKLRENSANKSEKRELNDLDRNIEEYKLVIEEAEEKIGAKNREINDKELILQEYQDRLIKAGSSMPESEIEALRKNLDSIKLVVEETSKELQSSFEMIPFAITGLQLLTVSEQLEIEKEYKILNYQRDKLKETEEKFLNDFREIYSKKGELLITHKVDEFYLNEVKNLVRKHFLIENIENIENIEEINILHDFSDAEKNEFLSILKNLQTSFSDSFARLNKTLISAENEKLAIRRKLSEAESKMDDPLIAKWKDERKVLNEEIQNLNREIGKLQAVIDSNKDLIQSNYKRRTEITKSINASEINREKDLIISRHIEQLKEIIRLLREQKKNSLQEKILNRLNRLMHKNNFVSKVDVSILPEDIEIKLIDARGQEIRKESLSKGEQQMYATSLLYALVEESEIEFPIFIDSPMQKFDEEHARNMILYFYPEVSRQVIILPLINKEMNSEEYNLLLPHIAQSWLIENKTNDQSYFSEVEPTNFLNKYAELYGSSN